MPTQETTPAIPTNSWEQPFNPGAISQIESFLPDFLQSRRWYRAKAQSIHRVTVQDVIGIPGAAAHILVIQVDYKPRGGDHYLIPVSLATGDQISRIPEELALLRLKNPEGEAILYDALWNPQFCDSLLNAIACSERFPGRQGDVISSRTSAFEQACGSLDPSPESRVSEAEQSNSSIIFGDRFILKLFRKIEPGTNPDLEIGTFLTENRFTHTPAVLGSLEYHPRSGEPMSAAILQQYVPNQGDAWKYTLSELSGFFERALAREVLPAPSGHPFELVGRPFPAEVQDLIGDYLNSARLLGERTAEMHAALAGSTTDPDFTPEPFSSGFGSELYHDMIAQADITFDLLRAKQNELKDVAAADGSEVLKLESSIRDSFQPLREKPVASMRIRIHGDFHLGQVLYTGTDFFILDFEGEPARPLAERRLKSPAFRDVAGMIRSFQYAAYAALFGQVPGVTPGPSRMPEVEAWAQYWTGWITATYLRAYCDAGCDLPFISPDPEERRMLLDAFLLHKALYEVAYELNNRPDWVRIPLRGIISLFT